MTTYICGAVGFGEGKSTGPNCISVYGAQQGDTCSGIVQKFSLNANYFTAINPTWIVTPSLLVNGFALMEQGVKFPESSCQTTENNSVK